MHARTLARRTTREAGSHFPNSTLPSLRLAGCLSLRANTSSYLPRAAVPLLPPLPLALALCVAGCFFALTPNLQGQGWPHLAPRPGL